MNRLFLLPVLSASMIGLAACGSPEPEAVEVAPGAAPAVVSDTRAEVATTQTALALGLTRDELEDADLVSPAPAFTDLGDVETLVLDAAGQVTGLVIDLEGVDKDVVVPIGDVTSLRREDDVDLSTTTTAAQLQALPAYTGPGA